MQLLSPLSDAGLLLLAGAGLVAMVFVIVRDTSIRRRSLRPFEV